MPSLLIWYIAAFRVLFAKPILDPSASHPLLTPVGSDTSEQLGLSPTDPYSPLSFGLSTPVVSITDQDNPTVFGTADQTQTGQVNKKAPGQITASAGISNPVVQDSDLPGQNVPE